MCVCVSVLPAVITQEIELQAGGGLCVPLGEMSHVVDKAGLVRDNVSTSTCECPESD